MHVPGHTSGHAGPYLPERRLLLGGDVALHRLPWRLSLPFAPFTSDMHAAVSSVARAARLAPDRLALGHGPPIEAGATRLLQRLTAAQAPPATGTG